jgi:CarboxypepD_reg-like domain/TonB-dependent Receptor Plug Domain
MYKLISFLLPLLAVSIMLSAQTPIVTSNSDIKGFVYDKNNGEPIIYTNVYLKGTSYGAQTDLNGYYLIKKVPSGNYTIMCTYVGYDTTALVIEVKDGQTINQKIFLSKKARKIKELVISAKKEEKLSEVQIGEIKATPVQIKQLPSIGGEPDLAQYLQVVPGVVSSGDQGGQLFIRGGAPVQNKIILDGMTIYNPFHSLGLFSVFETDLIKNANIKTAGFNANYGGATSAVVDVTTRDGNKKRLSGKVSANTFTSKIILEGPLKKMTDGNDGGSSSFLISAKSSYLDKSSKIFYNYADTTGNGLPYSFTDLYAKLSFNSNSGSKLNIFGFNFSDHANYQNVADYKWSSTGGGANFVVNPSNSSVLIKGNLAYSTYSLVLSEGNTKPRSTSIGGFNGNIDFGYTLEKNAFLNYGLEVNGFKTTYHFYNAIGIQVGSGQDQNTTELAAYMVYKKIVNKKLVIEPGLRLPYYASLNEFSFEPRLGVKYNIRKNLRFKGATGIYSQNLISTKSDRDIVNLFTGFLSGPEEELKTTEREIATSKLQKSFHIVGGFEYDLKKYVEFNVESYVKSFTQLVNINRDKLQVQDPNFMIESGYAYGGDISAKVEYKQFYLWVVYALGYVNRYDGTKNADGSKKYYAPPFDRRNNINVLFTYLFGNNQTWEFGARWNFGSGFPFTLTQGFYEKFNFNSSINANYITSNGQLGILYDKEINAGRLPYYHRLDISLKKKFYVGKNGLFEGVFSMTNAYNRANIFYYDRITNSRVNQLPVLPALGISYSF